MGRKPKMRTRPLVPAPSRRLRRALAPIAGLAAVGLVTAEAAIAPAVEQKPAPTVRLVPGLADAALPAVDVNAGRPDSYSPVRGFVAPVAATATKSDTPLVETPQSLSVVTRDQIEATGSLTVQDALRYTADIVDQTGQNGDRAPFFTARGFPIDKYIDGLGQVPGVGSNITPNEPFNYERIEVLRGPASVLYGQGNPGGVLNFVTKRPTETPLRQFEVQTSNYGQVLGAFDLGGPVTDDGTLLYRLTGYGRTSRNQVDYSRSSRVSIAPAVTWHPNADTTLTVLANYLRDPDSRPVYYPALGTVLPSPYRIKTSFNPNDKNWQNYDNSVGTVGYILDHRFDEVFSFHQNFRYETTASIAHDYYGYSLAGDGRTLSRTRALSHTGNNIFLLDTQAEAEFRTGPVAHDAFIGLDASYVEGRFKFGDTAPDTIDILTPNNNQGPFAPIVYNYTLNQNLEQFGFYAQDRLKLGKVAVTLSLREDIANQSTRFYLGGTSSRQTDTALTGRAGIVYVSDIGLAPYASFASSFAPQLGSDAAGKPFAPLTAKQYEAGVKYQPPGLNSVITVAAFQLTESSVLGIDPNNPNFSITLGEIRARGLEAEATASLADGLNLIASGNVLDQVTTKASTLDGTQGKHPAAIPRYQFGGFLNWKPPAGPATGVNLGGGVRFVSSSFGSNDNTFKVPGYTVFDAVVGYELGAWRNTLEGWRVQVNANNLLDKTYVQFCTSDSSCAFGLRRTVYANVRKTF